MTIGKTIWTYGDGTVVEKIHLTADKHKMLTKNNLDLFYCVDVDSTDGWYETYEEEEDFDNA